MIKNEQGLKHDEVVNGIAFNKRKNTLLLTGKNRSIILIGFNHKTASKEKGLDR